MVATAVYLLKIGSKAMKRLLILLLWAPLCVRAQAPAEAEEEILRNPSSAFAPGPIGTTDVRQDGTDHQAIIRTEESYVRAWQRGAAQQLQFAQQGANGQLLIRQEGANNQYEGTVLGDNNRLDIAQRGEDNLIRQDLVGDDLHYRLTQEGRGNELIQIEHDPLAPSYEVHQQGEGMQITIEQGFVGIPPQEP